MIDISVLNKLNAEDEAQRLENLRAAVESADFPPVDERMINNHIHTFYSFSPYSPSAAVYAARAEGLVTCGIVDHDSIGGAREFAKAGKIVGIPTTVGIEARVSMRGTPFENARTNNPDQIGVSYMVIHAVPHDKIDEVQSFFAPLREKRNERNRKMVAKINELYAPQGISLDFDRDVLPLSKFASGGSVTERHLMYALAKKLSDSDDMFEIYDLVGSLKKECIPKVYIDADEECPSLSEFCGLAKRVGAICAYAYLGDVTASVTGDKRAQTFEDAYLDELVACLAEYGVPAITYMPTRNTDEQLARLRGLCEKHGLMQISGEDVNSPRQSFRIEKMADAQFANLIDSTWELIRHENK
ncbi:MAG: PHP domain-containing protein [Oscillospiraceae bacterium]|nr:PHP domain-containing protein [Oscillospiraceae bacterium]MBQ4315770.1 PHP domain-containing protein [Oscillospiraceae bacterium]MBQ6698216.1 PHP domain-containing protein [Oscillospiraceae bacterium]